MPAVHTELGKQVIEGKIQSLGKEAPPIPGADKVREGEPILFEKLARASECTIVETGSPVGLRVGSLAREVGIVEPLHELVRDISSSPIGQDRMAKFIRHHAIRRAPIPPFSHQEGPKLTGHETFFLGQSFLGRYDDPDAIALTIALEGLALQKGQPERIPELLRLAHTRPDQLKGKEIQPIQPLNNMLHELLALDDADVIVRLQSRGFQQLPLEELRTINSQLGGILRSEHETINPSATAYRERLLQHIKTLPEELQRIYYFKRGENVRIVYAVPKIQEELAALHAPSVSGMADLARQLGLPLQSEYIEILYELMKVVSRGIEPVTRHILEFKK